MARRKQNKTQKIHLNINISGFDTTLFALTLILSLLGILSVANASAPQALAIFGDSYFFAKQQLKWLVIGSVFLIIGAFTPYQTWKQYAPHIFYATVFLLVLVLIPGFGSKLLGARRWISLGPLSFQPSELTKLTLAMMIAYAIDKKAPFSKSLGLIGLFAALIMLQPDLGTTIVVVGVGFSQLFVAGLPLGYFFSSITVAALGAGVLILLSEYRRARLISFLQSSQDPLNTSYHMKQILLALGSGGMLGVGLGQSRQKQLFLPETASDSVFAVIAEEVGFLGSLVVIMLLTFFVIRVFRIAKNAPDSFSQTLATGIGVWIGGQMFMNVASMVALVPLTGIPLPFFSYGGSSFVMILFAIGILLNISKQS